MKWEAEVKTIHKYVLDVVDRQVVRMPDSARVLCTQEQRGRLMIWAEVYQDAPTAERIFYVVGTGNPKPPQADVYVGTAQVGSFVWHVYEGRS